jgi:hypothetical protein
MGWTLIPAAQYASFVSDWKAVCERNGINHPLLSPKYIQCLLNHHSDHTTYVAVYKPGDVVEAMVLLSKVSPMVLFSFNPPQSVMLPFVGSADQVRISQLKGVLREAGMGCIQLSLLKVDPLYQTIDTDISDVEKQVYVRTITVTNENGFEQYWSQRKKKLRDNIKRYIKRVNNEGIDIRLEVFKRPEDIEQGVRDYGDIESRGWKGKQGSAVEVNNAQGRFYIELLQAFALSGDALIFKLYFGDQLVSCRFGIKQGNTVVFLKTTYDEAFSRNAPGRIQLFYSLQHIFDNEDAKTIEFYTDANSDQLQWASEDREIYHLGVYRSVWVGRFMGFVRRLKDRIKGGNTE